MDATVNWQDLYWGTESGQGDRASCPVSTPISGDMLVGGISHLI